MKLRFVISCGRPTVWIAGPRRHPLTDFRLQFHYRVMCILLGYDILAARRSDPKPIVFVILDVYIRLSCGGVGVGLCLRGLWRIDIAGTFLDRAVGGEMRAGSCSIVFIVGCRGVTEE
jgi:hypothetical protein